MTKNSFVLKREMCVSEKLYWKAERFLHEAMKQEYGDALKDAFRVLFDSKENDTVIIEIVLSKGK